MTDDNGVVLDFSQAATSENTPKVDGAKLLDDVTAFIRKFVRLTDAQAAICTTWAAHTHAITAATETPYLAINSAEKRSGKTRLLEVLELVVNRPWLTGRVTAACLVRKIDQVRPTLLLDESDAAFKGEKEYAEALRGVLNSGHREDGKASCCVGAGANITFKDFRTYGAKAIAGIGKNLPDTVMDRSIPIRLKRQAPSERVQRFRRRDVKLEGEELRSRLSEWLSGIIPELREARPSPPAELTDRQQDGIEPLLAIAEHAGGEWPERLRDAALEILKGQDADDQSIGVQLLTDIRSIFVEYPDDKITSEELIGRLLEIESSPWADWDNKGLSKGKLAGLLRRYDIGPRGIRVEGRTPRGYLRESFEDAWTRYLSPASTGEPAQTAPQNATVQQPAFLLAETAKTETQQNADVALPKSAPDPHKHCIVAGVALSNPDMAGEEGKQAAEPGNGSSFDVGAMALVEARLRKGMSVAPNLAAEYQRWLRYLDGTKAGRA